MRRAVRLCWSVRLVNASPPDYHVARAAPGSRLLARCCCGPSIAWAGQLSKVLRTKCGLSGGSPPRGSRLSSLPPSVPAATATFPTVLSPAVLDLALAASPISWPSDNSEVIRELYRPTLEPVRGCKAPGVSTKALRLYEECGLMKPTRTAAGWRAYGPEQMARSPDRRALRPRSYPR
jgi:hypothetical protein